MSLFATSAATLAADTHRGTVSKTALRVCADPGNLPFSNNKLEGFENKIIDLVGKELGLPVRYTWFPQTVGYIRKTLQAYECDLISGITTTNERVQNTNAYYHTVYTLVYVEKEGPFPTDFSDQIYHDKRIGLVAGTPPANLLAKQGLLSQIKPYHLMVDTRHDSSGKKMLEDLARGELDVAILWGPIAGYYAAQSKKKMAVIPLISKGQSYLMSFSITMAVRFNDQQFKHEINRVLTKLKPEIDKILKQHHVPLLNNLGQLIEKY